ncbi:MAG: HAMP domain-containing sensor histidine kinase [Marmoricola sp.]
MVGRSGRETRNARRTAFLAVVGLHAQRWPLFRRGHRRTAALERANDELRAARDAERRRADQLAEELARTREDVGRTLARVNDLFWTVEVLPSGDVTLTYLSADASGVVGGDVSLGLDAIAFREGLSHPDDAAVNAAFTAAMLAGEPAEVEERLVGLDGVVRWTWSRGTPRREGDRLFFDGVTTNISERHELAEQREELLRREQEQVAMLEEVHRSRDDFIALAGHELRTPLTIIQGYAEHLLEDGSIGHEQRSQLDIVVRRARSMSDLIDDLFDLAKLDVPLTSVAFREVRLDELVHESVAAHRSSASQRGIAFHVSAQPVEVTGDRGRLRRMYDNVIDNAVKFSRGGGRVDVVLGPEGDDAVLRVTDHGIGIPPDEMSRVFERLYRASNAVEQRYPGTGLGLSIALATAVAHGGTAAVDQAPDGGAAFTIRLPLEGNPHEVSDRA